MPNKYLNRPLRIGFIHPDLGLGGAEKLVVDAAVSLKRLGHEIVIFTSRHDPARCFKETKDGTLEVRVLGDWPIPRSIPIISLSILCSILRQLHLTLLLLLSLYLPRFLFSILPLSALNLRPLAHFDVFIVDQLSVCVPLIRWFAQSRVVFYCHFPDKLLAGGWEVGMDEVGKEKMDPRLDGNGTASGQAGGDVKGMGKNAKGWLKRTYRWPFDKLEEFTTGESDIVLANSHFTSRVYKRAFPTLKTAPHVVYPCIDVEAYTSLAERSEGDESVEMIRSDRPTFVSLNRFEGKKNAALAVEAFQALLSSGRAPRNLRLVIAGGYDKILLDNIDTLKSLQAICDTHGLSHRTITPDASDPSAKTCSVLFLLNFTDAQRSYLLTSTCTIALLYTAQNEHFGIVPVEAMACGLPVLAIDNGGPTETIVDTGDGLKGQGATGLLRPPSVEAWKTAMQVLIDLPADVRERASAAGKQRAKENFSIEKLGDELEGACTAVLLKGPVGMEDNLILLIGAAGILFFSLLFVVLYQLPDGDTSSREFLKQMDKMTRESKRRRVQ